MLRKDFMKTASGMALTMTAAIAMNMALPADAHATSIIFNDNNVRVSACKHLRIRPAIFQVRYFVEPLNRAGRKLMPRSIDMFVVKNGRSVHIGKRGLKHFGFYNMLRTSFSPLLSVNARLGSVLNADDYAAGSPFSLRIGLGTFTVGKLGWCAQD